MSLFAASDTTDFNVVNTLHPETFTTAATVRGILSCFYGFFSWNEIDVQVGPLIQIWTIRIPG